MKKDWKEQIRVEGREGSNKRVEAVGLLGKQQ